MAPVIAALKILLAVQASGAVVTGAVRSAESHQLLAGAVVELSDLGRVAATDANGRYSFANVPAGPQHILVRYVGHEARTLHALVPSSGELEINVSLIRKPVFLPGVEVRAPIALRGLEHDSATYPDREASISAVRNDPLLAEPDGFRALGGGEVVLDPESPTGVHIRGGSSDQTGYLLDGVPVFNPYHTAGVFSAWNPDALSRLQLTSTRPSSSDPDALSGVISAATLSPGYQFHTQGSLSNSQARLTADGPLGRGIGYLVSIRAGTSNLIPRKDESSYLKGGSGDWLAKLEAPAFGGHLRLLGYGSQNDINAAAATSGEVSALSRNQFEWNSRSLGAEWRVGRERSENQSGRSLRVLGWHAESIAESDWSSSSGPVAMAAARRDLGVLAQLDIRSTATLTSMGIRINRSHADFDVVPDSSGVPGTSLASRTVAATVFADQTRVLSTGFALGLGTALTASGRNVRLSPHVHLRWKAADDLTLTWSLARQHQFSQSLRNSESVVGYVFPADIYIGAGSSGIPIARSDLGVIAADYHPAAGLRLDAQVYTRRSTALLLVAPRESEPFSLGNLTTGSATSRGVSLSAAFSSTHIGVMGSYGLQQVRYHATGGSYVPGYGATHLIDAGVIVFPTATTSIRLGANGALGRRTTIISNNFEWESCNLRDSGCEFGGSPHYQGETLGGTPLPGYFRVDLGARKHWHFDLSGRPATVALFATVTNLLNRRNILTYSRNSHGEPVAVEMRPRSPLVIGVDWEF